MNGPIILDNAREQLADEIVSYCDPKPLPLKISPWLAMSLLQKSVRRGESELAQHAAATLLLTAPDRLWRRCGAAAFEDIGAADLQTISLVTAALAGKRFRATIGGEWKVASFIVDRMTRAPKCRAADDLLLTADSHPRYQRARADLATKTTRELIHIATGDATLPVRALAAWFAVGSHPRQTKHLSVRPGEPAALFDGLCEAGLPHTAVEIAREGFRKIGEPLCPFVALLCPLATAEPPAIQDDDMPPVIMVGQIPGWACDIYNREGRQALQALLQRDCETSRWVRAHIPPRQRVEFLGTIVFRLEGGCVRRRLRWPLADELRRLTDYECNGPHCLDASEILQLARADLGELNAIRAELVEASSYVS